MSIAAIAGSLPTMLVPTMVAWSEQVCVLTAAGALAALTLTHLKARLRMWQGLLVVLLLLPAIEPWNTASGGGGIGRSGLRRNCGRAGGRAPECALAAGILAVGDRRRGGTSADVGGGWIPEAAALSPAGQSASPNLRCRSHRTRRVGMPATRFRVQLRMDGGGR